MQLYNQDVLECEDSLYEDASVLVEYAKEHFKEFVIDSDAELIDVRYDGNLIIEYKAIADYDENDKPIFKTEKEEFDVTPREMMVNVPTVL